MAEQNLREKTIEGVTWSGIDNVAQYGTSFLISIFLARLLTPDDYGLIGIITIFITVCYALINSGFSIALIRKKNATDEDYNTVFYVNVVISIFLYFVLCLCSPVIANFFNRTELVWLIRISSLGMIIGAISMVQQTILTKRIDFKSQTKITIVTSIVSGVIGIIFALLHFGVWALVTQSLVNQTLRTILLGIANKWKPRLIFSMTSFRDLFGFGWKMMVGGLLDTFWKEIFQVIVGKFYSPASLGQYTRSLNFSQLFSNNLTAVVQRVTFPILSTLQDDKKKMVSAYRKIIKMTMFITAIGMFFLGAISEPLLYCLIGPQWYEAATYLPVICIASSTYPLHALNLNMLEVQGRSDLFLGLEIVKKIILIGPLVIGATIGIMPMLYANIVTTTIAFFLNSHYSGKLIGYSSWMQIKDIFPSYLIASLIAVAVYPLKYLTTSNWIILPLQISVGLLIFIAICKLFKIYEYDEIKNIALSYMKNCK